MHLLCRGRAEGATEDRRRQRIQIRDGSRREGYPERVADCRCRGQSESGEQSSVPSTSSDDAHEFLLSVVSATTCRSLDTVGDLDLSCSDVGTVLR